MTKCDSKTSLNGLKAGRAMALAVIMLTMGQTGYLGSAQQSTSQTTDGAHLLLGEAMTDITFQYDADSTCSVSPALPAGLSIDSSTCTISGTPSVYAANQTYIVHANQSDGTTLAYEV